MLRIQPRVPTACAAGVVHLPPEFEMKSQIHRMSVVLTLLWGAATGCAAFAQSSMDITTWQVNTSHTGVNPTEQTLTPAFVGPNNVTCLYAAPVDGQVNAQVLYLTSATSNKFSSSFPDGAPHNAVYVATQNGTIYAFDADLATKSPNGCKNTAASASDTSYLWKMPLASLPANLGGRTPNGTPEYYQDIGGAGDISPLLGQTQTPVIDPTTGTLYTVVTVRDTNTQDAADASLGLGPNTPFVQILYALDVKSGAVKGTAVINPVFNGDYTVPTCNNATCDTVPSPGTGKIPFIPEHQHLRSGMILDSAHETVWLAYASHNDQTPYYGLILGYNVSNPAAMTLDASFIASPASPPGAQQPGMESGIWMSGASPALDPTTNQLFVATANGKFSQPVSSYTQNTNWGYTMLSLSSDPAETVLTHGVPEMQLSYAMDPNGRTWFTPSQWTTWDQSDKDLGSGGLLLLPPTTDADGNPINLMIGGGKAGDLYVVNRAALGGIAKNDSAAANPNALQQIQEPGGSGGFGSGIFDTPVYFNGNIYYSGGAAVDERSFGPYDADTKSYVSPSEIASQEGPVSYTPNLFISASSLTSGGVVWQSSNGLTAWDAAHIANKAIYSANAALPTGQSGQCQTATFHAPIVDSGKIFFSCFQQPTSTAPSGNKDGYLLVYGPTPKVSGVPTSAPVLSAVANSSGQVTLTWTYSGTGNTGFQIMRSQGGSSNYGNLNPSTPLAANSSSYIDTSISPNTLYYYTVAATNANGPGYASQGVPATTLPVYAEDGLVAYWPLDETQKSLTSSPDVTGHGHTAVQIGGNGAEGYPCQNNPGVVNNCWFFHGTLQLDALSVADAPDLEFTKSQSFTLAAWVNYQTVAQTPPDGTSAESAVITKSSNTGNQYGIYINTNGNWDVRGPQGDIVGPAASLGAWTHVAVVQDGSKGTRTLYTNGQAVASGPAQDGNGTGALLFADENKTDSQGNNDVGGFAGDLDEIRLYNQALTPGAIADLMGAPVLSASSILPSGSQRLGVSLFPSIVPATEPRIPAGGIGAYTLTIQFAAPLSTAPAAILQSQIPGGSVTGTAGQVTLDSTGTVATVPLAGVANAQALNLHLSNIVSGGTITNGVQDIPFDVLYGDVSQDHHVDSYDSTAVQNAYSGAVSTATAAFDLNGDGVIDSKDLALVNGNENASFNGVGDASLAFYKKAYASSTINTNSGAAEAFDNNLADNWESLHAPSGCCTTGTSVDPGWIYVDLGTPAAVDGFSIQWAGSAAATYTIDACTGTVNSSTGACSSANGWQTMVSQANNTNNALRTYTNLPAVTAEFFRMNGTVRVNAPYGYQINEFYVFGTYTPSGSTPPANPTLTAPAVTQPTTSGTQVILTWSASANATSYSVYRGTAAGGESTTPVTTTSGTSFTDSNTASGTTYFYYVTASASGYKTSSPSTEVHTTPQGTLTAPAVNQPTATSSQITLTWSASASATSYSIFRGTTSGGESTTPIATVSGTSFTDSSIVDGTMYFYYVTASATGYTSSAPSSQVQATPPVPAPAAPGAFTLSVSSPSSTSVTLNWTQSSGAISYQVLRGSSAGNESTALQTTSNLTYTDSGLASSTQYFYKVVASNSGPSTTASNEQSVTTQAAATPPSTPVGTPIYQIDSGSGSASGAFAADGFYTGGSPSSVSSSTQITVGSGDSASMTVYQTNRVGSFSYMFPQLAKSATYNLVLHFAETYSGTASVGARVFSVTSNGAPITCPAVNGQSPNCLTNLDIFAQVGYQKALVISVPVTSDGNGNLKINFVPNKNNPQVNAIELLTASGSSLPPSVAPVNLLAMPGNLQNTLSWNPGAGPTGTYTITRGTAAGAETTVLPNATNVMSTFYVDNDSPVAGKTYFYRIMAANASGGAYGEASATTNAVPPGTPVIQMAAGSATAITSGNVTYTADPIFGSTNASVNANKINMSGVVNPAPAGVYQTEHSASSFTYAFTQSNGLKPNATVTVRLHFAETWASTVGQRVFNVSCGSFLLNNFDIYAATNGKNTAIVEEFTTTTDSTGHLNIVFTSGSANQPKIDGIEVYQ